MIHRLVVLTTVLLGLSLSSASYAQANCNTDIGAVQGVDAVLYDQRSIEHALIAEQTYLAATAALQRAKAAPGDALLPDAPLPPTTAHSPLAVILDVDETVLDNSPAQAYLVKNNVGYCDPAWDRWLASQAATAIPGAVAFTQAAKRAKVDVFYVTNRACPSDTPGTCPAKVSTMAVMARLGFARANDPNAFLLKGERADWTSDKSTRRAFIAKDHRVIMMLGDQLTDFVSPVRAEQIWTELQTPIVSAAIAASPPSAAYSRYKAMVGKRWFVLSNSQYGFYQNRFKTAADRVAALQAADIGGAAPPP